MTRERLYLFDTTLRDGAQTNGVDFTLHDKQIIARMLDELGIDYVEGGYPGANPTDTEFFATKQIASALASRMPVSPGSFEDERPGRRVMPNAVKRACVSFGFAAKNSVSVGLAPG